MKMMVRVWMVVNQNGVLAGSVGVLGMAVEEMLNAKLRRLWVIVLVGFGFGFGFGFIRRRRRNGNGFLLWRHFSDY